MSTDIETSVVQIGLRDFLFYVVPGALLLTGILTFSGVGVSDMQPYLGLTSSVAAIMVSYILGQCSYPIVYVFRRLLNRIGNLESLPGEHTATFKSVYYQIAADAPLYFAIEIFRYRTLARFCSAMIFPVLFAGAGIAFCPWDLSMEKRVLIMILGLIVSAGFAWRYHRYEGRYRSACKEKLTALARDFGDFNANI